MKTPVGKTMSSAARGAYAAFDAHVRKQRGYFASAYDLAKARARARDEHIAARLGTKEKAAS